MVCEGVEIRIRSSGSGSWISVSSHGCFVFTVLHLPSRNSSCFLLHHSVDLTGMEARTPQSGSNACSRPEATVFVRVKLQIWRRYGSKWNFTRTVCPQGSAKQENGWAAENRSHVLMKIHPITTWEEPPSTQMVRGKGGGEVLQRDTQILVHTADSWKHPQLH